MRLKYVDGLRGIAAFIVMLSHIFIVALPSLYNGLPMMARLRWEWRLAGTPLDIFWAANFAVCIFFVMSGLVLSAFCDKQEMNFVANCVRRYVRLGLPIFGGCAFAYFLYAVGLMQPSAAQRITQEGWLKLIYTEPLTFMHLIHRVFLSYLSCPDFRLRPAALDNAL